MRLIRRLHLYLGCFFSPLLLYFAVSGAWQVFSLNDVPKQNPTAWRQLLHEWSKPHKDSTLPGENPKQAHSLAFRILAVLMALGLAVTMALGILMAFQILRRPMIIAGLLIAGLALPVVFLFLH